MKLKHIAAVCMSLCATSSFAVTLACSPFNATTPDAHVNTCAPEAKMMIAGSSALGNALAAVVPADLFDTTTQPITKVIGSVAGALPQNATTTAWYGMSKPALTGGVSKRLFVVYNNNNGSAAGVSQLLSKLGTVAEADVVTTGPVKNVAGTCVTDATSTAAAPVVACSTHAMTQADIAISDVHPSELYKLYASATGKLTTLASTPLAMQGFGVAVNWNLYMALQTKGIADGTLPATCVAGDLTAACQPSIRRAEYASLVAQDGAIKSAAALLNNPADTTQLILARRDDLSGTQASSNIFFANANCGGMGYNATTGLFNYNPAGTTAAKQIDKTVAAVLGGGLDIISIADNSIVAPAVAPAINSGVLAVQSNATGGGVTTTLNAAGTAYAIGVIGLGSTQPATAGTWKFVKIDGQSPTFNPDGTSAYKQRTAFANGNYPFAMTAFAVTPVKPAKTAVGTTFPTLVSTLIGGLKDSTLHDLPGIAYLDGAADAPGIPKQSHVTRTAGNNCSPLVKF